MELLDTISALSHEFGTEDYVIGGGGNTSAKNAQTLWVKPSGTTLGGLNPKVFVALDRSKISELYETPTPAESHAREALVKDLMMAAVCPGYTGRPSVEAPLHNTFSTTFVVHTHPTLVNGMTCARDGAQVCADLFPNALWVPYVDPGYTVCMRVREAVLKYANEKGREPNVVFLKNHGVFVTGNSPEEIRGLYLNVMNTLTKQYRNAGVTMAFQAGAAAPAEVVEDTIGRIQALLGTDAAFVCAAPSFDIAPDPISPDHIVYAKSYPMIGEPTSAQLDAFVAVRGYKPRVIVCDAGVFGVGDSQNAAALALAMAKDGSRLKQITQAFGGIEYMTRAAELFIDNWEVEAYRRKQI